jgi:hypothetical protein
MTDILQFRFYPTYDHSRQHVLRSGRVRAPATLTADIRALHAAHAGRLASQVAARMLRRPVFQQMFEDTVEPLAMG